MASNGHRSGGGRSALSNEIIINASAGETRIALLEGGSFTELHIERERDRNVAGMVAKGRVKVTSPPELSGSKIRARRMRPPPIAAGGVGPGAVAGRCH